MPKKSKNGAPPNALVTNMAQKWTFNNSLTYMVFWKYGVKKPSIKND